MSDLTCQAKVETFISDFNLFKNGAENADVTLSDGIILPSYRKYSISDLTRTGNNLENKLYFKDDIISYNGDLYICLNNVIVSGLVLNPVFWKKQGNPTAGQISGKGISAYLEFDFNTNTILNSQGIASVISNPTSGDLDITLIDYVDPSLKLCCVSSVDCRKLTYTDISNPNFIGLEGKHYTNSGGFNYVIPDGYYKKMVSGRIISNSGNFIQVSIRQGGYFVDVTYNTLSSPGYPTAKTINYINSNQIGVFKPIVSFLFLTY